MLTNFGKLCLYEKDIHIIRFIYIGIGVQKRKKRNCEINIIIYIMYSVVMFYYEHNQKIYTYIHNMKSDHNLYVLSECAILPYTDMYNICFVCFVYTLQICLHDKHLTHRTIVNISEVYTQYSISCL